MEKLPVPNDRVEALLYAIATGDGENLPVAKTREEKLLMYILENGSMAPGGGGGTSDVAWKPTVAADGTISWIRSVSTTPPAAQNIKGPQGDPGENGAPGLDGADGKSAYQIWLDTGNTGTEDDFLLALIGAPGPEGKSAYQIWLDLGNTGTEEDFINYLIGEDGFSPTITPNPDNTDDVYKLDITTKDGTFTTPNLRGGDEVTKYTYAGRGNLSGETYYSYEDLSTKIGETVEVTVSNRYGENPGTLEIISILSDTELEVDNGSWIASIMLIGTQTIDGKVIDDNRTSTTSTWSSTKIKDKLDNVFDNLTDEQKESLRGEDGFSPIITENADNTDDVYKLDIETKDDKFTTPNLKGKDGEGSKSYAHSVKVIGTVGSTYYSTNIDYDKIREVYETGNPISLYGGWTLDRVVSADDSMEAFSKFAIYLDKQITATPAYISVYDLFSIQHEPAVSVEPGTEYTVTYEWNDSVIDDETTSTETTWSSKKIASELGSKTYTSLVELELTADATVEDVVNALKNGESFLAPVNTFTNYETMFPNKVPNDQWNKIHIIKGTSLGNSHIRCFSQSGACEYLANVNNTNIVSWNDVSGTYIDISDAVIEKLGNEILKYPVGRYRINSTTTGNKFTDLPSNDEIKCGLIEINGTAVGKSPFTDTWVYRMYKFECLTGTSSYVRRLNSGATVGQIELDTGWQKEAQQIYNYLSQLGLTAPVSVGEIFNAMPDKSMAVIACEDTTDHITDVPTHYGVLTIKKNEIGRFSIDYQISLASSPCNVKKWIGTLKGDDGTGLYWKQLSAEPTFVTLNDIGLTADATFQDVVDALPKGCSALLGVKDFTNYQTMFPYEEGNDQFARVHIVKGVADGSCVYARWFRKDGVKEAIAIFNINDNKFNGWQKVATRTITTLAELGLTSSATLNDVYNKLGIGQTALLSVQDFNDYQTLFPYSVDSDKYARVEIHKGASTAHSRVMWFMKNGSRMALGNIGSDNTIVGWIEYTTKGYVDSKHNYSTTETAIGTWIDGKTIYRKTFTKSPTSNQATGNQVTIDVATISGLTNVINIQATAKLQNYNNTSAPIYAKIPFGEMWRSNSGYSGAYVDSVYVEGTTLKLHVNNCSSDDIYYVTVEYTK